MRESVIKFRRRTRSCALIDLAGLIDARLSWRATGILAHCMGLPAHHRITMTELRAAKVDGDKSLRSGMRELRKFGYARLESIRDIRGRVIGTEWTIFEHYELNDSFDKPPHQPR